MDGLLPGGVPGEDTRRVLIAASLRRSSLVCLLSSPLLVKASYPSSDCGRPTRSRYTHRSGATAPWLRQAACGIVALGHLTHRVHVRDVAREHLPQGDLERLGPVVRPEGRAVRRVAPPEALPS